MTGLPLGDSRLLRGLVVFVAATTTGRAQVLFTDVSSTSGFSGTKFFTNNSHALGVTWLDFDGDGWDDLFLVNGKGYVKELYRNQRDGHFVLRNDLLPSLPDVEMMGAVAGDYDNDGDIDLYVFCDHEVGNFDNGPHDGPLNLLLRNDWVENGGAFSSPLFTDVATVAGVDDVADPPLGTDYPGHRSTIGGFLDFDRDGLLDLYVGRWAMSAPNGDPANQDVLYHNKGDGTFKDVTASVGLPVADDLRNRPTLGFIAAHLDHDLWPDLYVGHTETSRKHALDTLYRHDGIGGYLDVTGDSPGLGDDATANMGVVVSDIENDGDFDLYMSDLVTFDPGCNPLYLTHGDGTFDDDAAAAAGIVADDSWAVVFLDADQDMYEDLFVGTTWNSTHDNFFFRNRHDGTFADVTTGSGVDFHGDSRGGAAADYDHDGDLDLAWVDSWRKRGSGGFKLLRNDTLDQGHQLAVKLTGTVSNASAIGARITARVGTTKMLRQIVGGSGAHGQNSLVAHFGLADSTVVDELTIEWPSGVVEVLHDVAADQLIKRTESVGTGLALAAMPDLAGEGETITIATTCGEPNAATLLAIIAVDGIPVFTAIDFGAFDLFGRRDYIDTIPPIPAGFTVTCQAFGIESASHVAGLSPPIVVTVE